MKRQLKSSLLAVSIAGAFGLASLSASAAENQVSPGIDFAGVHYACYKVKDDDVRWVREGSSPKSAWWFPKPRDQVYEITNQFGTKRITLGDLELLCAPTKKVQVGSAGDNNHDNKKDKNRKGKWWGKRKDDSGSQDHKVKLNGED
jgi:hypothetical protein